MNILHFKVNYSKNFILSSTIIIVENNNQTLLEEEYISIETKLFCYRIRIEESIVVMDNGGHKL